MKRGDGGEKRRIAHNMVLSVRELAVHGWYVRGMSLRVLSLAWRLGPDVHRPRCHPGRCGVTETNFYIAAICSFAIASIACSTRRMHALPDAGQSNTAASSAGALRPTSPSSAPAVSAGPSIGEEVQTAFETLRAAGTFESAHIGENGNISDNVKAFRLILHNPQATRLFHELVAAARLPGKLYGLCGLYFTDPGSFQNEVAKFASDRTSIPTLDGCIVDQKPVDEIVRSSSASRIRIRKGETYRARMASIDIVKLNSSPCDIAGGCRPLSFLDEDRPAMRDPI